MKVGLTALVAVVIALAAGGAQAAGAISGRGTWETTLQYRDLDGNVANGPEAFYDTVLDITWLRDANVNMGNNVNGSLEWPQAVTWANNLVVNGIDGWRLLTMMDTGAPGCDFSYGAARTAATPRRQRRVNSHISTSWHSATRLFARQGTRLARCIRKTDTA